MSLPAVAQDPALHQHILSTLGDQLKSEQPLDTRLLLQHLATTSDLDQQRMGDILLSLLQVLDQQRKKKTEEWQRLVALGGDRVKPKTMDKMFKEWIKRTRKIIVNNENSSLAKLIKHGAHKAEIPDYRSRAILLQTMGIDTDRSAVYLGFPHRSVLLLEDSKVFQRFAGGSGVQLGRDANARHTSNPISQDVVQQNLRFYFERAMRQSPYIAQLSTRPGYQKPDGLLTFGLRRFKADMKEYEESTDTGDTGYPSGFHAGYLPRSPDPTQTPGHGYDCAERRGDRPVRILL